MNRRFLELVRQTLASVGAVEQGQPADLPWVAARLDAEDIAGLDRKAESICRRAATEASIELLSAPTPAGDSLALVPCQVRAVAEIAALYGCQLRLPSLLEFLASVGPALGGRSHRGTLDGLLVRPWGLVGPAYPAVATYTLTTAARAWFRNRATRGPDRLDQAQDWTEWTKGRGWEIPDA